MKNLDYKINFWLDYIGSAIVIAIMIVSSIVATEYYGSLQSAAMGLCLINIISSAAGIWFLYQAIFEDYEKAYGEKNATAK